MNKQKATDEEQISSFTGWGIKRVEMMRDAMLQIQERVFNIVKAKYPECYIERVAGQDEEVAIWLKYD